MKKIEKIKSQGIRLIRRVKSLSLKKKLVIVLIVFAAGWFMKPFILRTNSQEVQYQTSTAEIGTLISSISASGNITTSNRVSVTTLATGIVKEVSVKNGDMVNQGDTIALLTLDQSSLQKQTAAWASYLTAQNNVNTQKSKMNSLQAALFTASEAFTNGAGTNNPNTSDPQYIIERAEWLQAEANYTQQKDIINQAEVALSSAWLTYAQTSSSITAPIGGLISNLTLSPGVSISQTSSTTANNSSSTTSTNTSYGTVVLSDQKPQASVNLSEIDVTQVAVGQKVILTLDAFPDKTFTGTVTLINTNGSVTSGITTYPATITLDTTVENMYPNMTMTANIITDTKTDVLLVPSSAIQTTNGQSTVRGMRNNQLTTVTVEVGKSNDTQTEIISGIDEGETVITGQTIAGSTQPGASSPFGNTNRGGFGGAGGFGGGAVIRR